MALNLPVFYKRTGSAVIYAAIMLSGLLMKDNLSIIFLASIIQVLCFREYFPLVQKIEPDTSIPSWLPLTIQAISLVWLWLPSCMYNLSSPWPAFLCAPAFILIITILPERSSWKAGILSIAGMLYITLPMILLIQIHSISMVIPLALVVMIWTSDTMAYLVGSFIGKTPFSPISPNKTWEGIIGGAVLTIAIGGVFGYFSHYYNIADWMILSLIVSVTAPLGDLLVSKLKRLAGVKDTGTIMPGHGGALDRFDSLLIVVPFAFSYIWFYMPSMLLALH